MKIIPYKKTSFYYDTQFTAWNSLDMWVPREIPLDGTDQVINLDPQYQYRPDRYSYDLYGTSTYAWVFMMMNKDIIIDPIFDFKAGIRIYIASYEKITRIIGG